MELQLKWIEKLFSRLQSMYGNSFSSMWANADLNEVKRIWAERLGGFNSRNIADALNSLDEKPYPPNLPEFVSLCRQALRVSKPDVPPPTVGEASRVIKEVREKTGATTWKVPGKRDWAEKIKFKHEHGERMMPFQVSMACDALKAES